MAQAIPATALAFTPPVLHNFHFYSDCGNSVSWNPDWYTQDWFTQSRSYYDAQASTGQVEPPLSVILTEPVCASLSASLASESRLSESAVASASLASVSSVSVAATATTSANPSPASNSRLPTQTGSVATGSRTQTGGPQQTGRPPGQGTIDDGGDPNGRPSGDPTCAGDWDDQAKGVVAATVWSTLVGLLVWLLFALLRGRFAVLYEARRWFSPAEDRPYPVHASILSFLFPPVPFLPSLGSGSTSDERMAIRTVFVALRVAFVWTVLSLLTALPLYMVNVPCGTTIRSRFGGATGSLTDLSILRLLDAINPNAARDSSASNSISSSVLSELVSFATDPGSVTNPPNARTRLLILTILVPLITTLPGLFTVIRAFSGLIAHRNKFLTVTCAGLEMGFLPFSKDGLGEERVREVLREAGLMAKHGATRLSVTEGEAADHVGESSLSKKQQRQKAEEEAKRVEVLSVFGVPTTTRLDRLVAGRKDVLDKLEENEVRYINAFSVDPITREHEEENAPAEKPPARGFRRHQRTSTLGPPSSFVAPSSYYRLRQPDVASSAASSPGHSPPDSPGAAFTSAPVRPPMQQSDSGSRFREVERDSGFWGGKAGKLQVGNRLRADQEHGLVYDPSPESEDPGYRTSGAYTSAGSNPATPGAERASRERDRQRREAASSTEDVGSTELVSGEDTRVMRQRGGADPEAAVVGAPSRPAMRQRRATGTGPLPSASQVSLVPLHDRLDAGIAPVTPGVRSRANISSEQLGLFYSSIRKQRGELKRLNAEIEQEQGSVFDEMAAGRGIKGYMLLGRGIRFIPHVRLIEGYAKEDIIWSEIQNGGTSSSARTKMAAFWATVLFISIALAWSLVPFIALTVADAPGVSRYLGVLRKIAASTKVSASIVEGLVPAVEISLLMVLAVVLVILSSRLSGAISHTRRRMVAYQAICLVVLVICGAWVIVAASLLFATQAIVEGTSKGEAVADGSIFASAFLFIFLINAALIGPGLQLLQPVRAYKMLRALRKGATPRQKWRASKPRLFNSSYGAAVCLLAVFYAATFIVLFPLIGIPVVLILVLTLVALRYTQYYVYVAGIGNSGGAYALWSLRRSGVILACQPLLFGLILASRDEWNFAIAMFVVAGIALFIIEAFTAWRSRIGRPSFRHLPSETRRSLKSLDQALVAASDRRRESVEPSTADGSLISSAHQRRGSHSSIADMLSRILPGREEKRKWAIPLRVEDVDDLLSTEVAARTHPNAPPHLPPLSFADPAEEMRAFIYPPSLLAPPPTIWLPADDAGVGRLEVLELGRYHSLAAIATDLEQPNGHKTTVYQPGR